MAREKFYVVWNGVNPGIYDSWEECQLQIKGFKDARFKSYTSLEAATEAYRGDPAEQMALFRAMAHHKPLHVNYDAFPEIRRDAIAVDAACSRNPGPVEYQGRDGRNRRTDIPYRSSRRRHQQHRRIPGHNTRGGTATPPRQPRDPDILRLQDGTVMDTQRGTPVKMTPTPRNAKIMEMLQRADAWLHAHRPIPNPILKWDTDQWGDPGRLWP